MKAVTMGRAMYGRRRPDSHGRGGKREPAIRKGRDGGSGKVHDISAH